MQRPVKNSKLKRFNPENCDIRTQLMFEDWATLPAYKILTYLLARKGKSIYSARGIGEILNLPKSTVIHTLKLLIQHEYITKEGSNYYLNVGLKSDQPIGQSTNPLVTVDQPIGQESTNPLVTNNDKRNNNKTITSADFVFPPNLDRKECKDAIQGWIQHRFELKKRVTKSSIDQVLKAYRDRPGELVRDIKHSVKNCWQGIFAPKPEPPVPPPKGLEKIAPPKRIRTANGWVNLDGT